MYSVSVCVHQVQSCHRGLFSSAWHRHPSTGGPDRDRGTGQYHSNFEPFSLNSSVVLLFYESGHSSCCGSLYCHAVRIRCLCVGSWTDLVQAERCHVGFLHAAVMQEIWKKNMILSVTLGESATGIYGCNHVVLCSKNLVTMFSSSYFPALCCRVSSCQVDRSSVSV